MKISLKVEIQGKSIDKKNLTITVKELWKKNGGKIKDIKTLDMYLNLDESKCYYVINLKNKGSFNI